MPYKLLIVDPDPGMRHPISDPGGFINKTYDQKLRPKMLDALSFYAAEGWHIFAVTNQGGIGSGKIESFAEGEAIQAYLMTLAPMIQGVLFCPAMDGRECFWKSANGDCSPVHETEAFKTWNFRQPAPGMIDVLKTVYVPDEVLVIGSRVEDADSARKAKVPYQTIDEWINDWEALPLQTVSLAQ